MKQRRVEFSEKARLDQIQLYYWIAFTVEEEQVVILRLFYGGQNWSDLV